MTVEQLGLSEISPTQAQQDIWTVGLPPCQYVPLDGGIAPDETVKHLLTDTDAKYVLCLERFKHRVEPIVGTDYTIYVLDDAQQPDVKVSAARPTVSILPTDGAYMIYTSGTTGKPKGVDVSHVGGTNLLCLHPGNLGITPGTNVAQCLSISFDMETLSTLMNGGTLLLRTSDWIATLKRYRKADYPNIKVAVVGGEPCPKILADEWSNDCHIINCCGSTEVSILNTMLHYDPSRPLSIGSPVSNTNVYILDEDENPVPIGEKGYMWAGGRCVSRGYLNLPELTSKRYKLDKFANDGSYMFNTGDPVKWLDCGNLDHQGRGDDQVKIKGFRVELDSMSSAIERTPGILKACAISKDNVLWAFYSGTFLPETEIKERVAKSQPYYAIPSRWEYRAILPLTLNGKIDKRALMTSVADTTNASHSLAVPAPVLQISPLTEKRGSTSTDTTAASSTHTVSSFGHKKTDLNVECGESMDDEDIYPVPDKKGVHGLRALRYKFFSLYRRLFTVVFAANLSIITWILVTRSQRLILSKLAVATAANFTVAILMRQDHVVNLDFTIFCSVPTSAPLFIRRNFARIFHIGGIHSGAAVLSTLWFLMFTITATVQGNMPAVIGISWTIQALLFSIVITAYPAFRQRFHNKFELSHRFAGWTAIGLFWIQTILTTDATRGMISLGQALVQILGFWLLVISTSSIILPWINLRKVEVRADVLSNHAVRLYFNYTTPAIGSGVRISYDPLLEWHAFTAIPKPNEKGFSLLVSKAGDWTTDMIENPVSQVYVRGVPACGVLRIATLFKSIVLVSTGSRIGPCLPVIYARQIPARIIWSTPRPEKTFGMEIISSIKRADERAIIHDMRAQGRLDLVAMSYKAYRESGAEAVCAISNQKVTKMLVYAMESRGIPAFGAVFDS